MAQMAVTRTADSAASRCRSERAYSPSDSPAGSESPRPRRVPARATVTSAGAEARSPMSTNGRTDARSAVSAGHRLARAGHRLARPALGTDALHLPHQPGALQRADHHAGGVDLPAFQAVEG